MHPLEKFYRRIFNYPDSEKSGIIWARIITWGLLIGLLIGGIINLCINFL